MTGLTFDQKLTEEGKVQLLIDHRELKSGVAKKLFQKGTVLTPVQLPVGDFIASDRVAVERKDSKDFENSIIDGRLFSQMKELKDNFSSPLIALVGSTFERLRPEALRGAIISITVDYKMPLLFFDNDDDLAEFLYALAEREQLLEKREARLQFVKKGKLLAERQQLIVESLPGIGPKTAKNILRHIRTIQSLANAEPKQLEEIEGVGKLRAKEIRKVFEEEYTE